jgi:glycogen(starch) synthase
MDAEAGPTVLMTTDTVGGVWHYALQLSKSLIRGHRARIALATMGAPLSSSQRRQAAETANLTLHESSFRLEWMAQPWEDVERAGEWLLALQRELRPDIVHLNQFAFGSLPFQAPTLLVAHSCVVSWWQAVKGVEPPPQWDRYREVVRNGLAGADLVAAPSRDMLASLVRNHGFGGDGRVLPNGRDPVPGAPLPGAPASLSKQPLIISAGRLWDEAKNLQALEAVAASVPWPIEVAGAVQGPDGTTRVARGLRLLGELPADRLAQRFAQAAICAHPARYEPFGLAPLEAALAGCALVLGDLPSLREIWGDCALYVPPDDHPGLQRALLYLIEKPDLRSELARRAGSVALRHSGAAMARGYLAAYRDAAHCVARAPAGSSQTAMQT